VTSDASAPAPDPHSPIVPLERRASEATTPPPGAGPEARWRAFHELGLLLTSARIDVGEVLSAVLDLAIRHAGAERGLLFLAHDDDEGPAALGVELARAAGGRFLAPSEISYSRSVLRRALEERRSLRLSDVVAAAGGGAAIESADRLGIRSAMCAPLIVLSAGPQEGLSALSVPTPMPGRAAGPEAPTERRRVARHDAPDLLGAVYVDASARGPFSEADLQFFEALSQQATATILAARLYEQAAVDPLTGLLTRAQLHRRLPREEARARRRRAPWAIAVLDLDDFKRVNDVHGHRAGDAALREVGATVRATLRSSDAAFRYGGDEVVVVLRDADAAGAAGAAERIRAALAERRYTDECLALGFSLGVAASAPEEPLDGWALFQRADRALALAKRSGKGRVVPWSAAGEAGAAAPLHDSAPGAAAGAGPLDEAAFSALVLALAGVGGSPDAAERLSLALERAGLEGGGPARAPAGGDPAPALYAALGRQVAAAIEAARIRERAAREEGTGGETS
jgi:diguanylate cyclase (GGDEF)-like protein